MNLNELGEKKLSWLSRRSMTRWLGGFSYGGTTRYILLSVYGRTYDYDVSTHTLCEVKPKVNPFKYKHWVYRGKTVKL